MTAAKEKHRFGWPAALALGLLCASALSCEITVADPAVAEQSLAFGLYDGTAVSIDGAPKLLVLFAKLRQNLPWDNWAWAVCAAALAALFLRLWRLRGDRPGPVMAVFSAVFGAAQVLGLSICKLDSWAFVAENSYQLLLSLFCMAGYAVLFYHAVWGLFALLARLGGRADAVPQGRFAALWARRTAPLSALPVFLCWLPWLIACLPGSVDWDSHTQICQALGLMEMTAHHPVLSTWLHGGAVALGRALGSDNLGVFLYVLAQSVFCAWVCGQFAAFAQGLGCPRGVQYAVTAFFALVPAWGAFAQSMVKDTLFAAVFALFVLCTAQRMLSPQEYRGRPAALARYLLLAVLTCLLRQTGLYAVVPALLAAAWAGRRAGQGRQMLACAAAVLVIVEGFNTAAVRVLGIEKGSAREILSVPFQQTGRYVKLYGDEVTEAERAAIDAVLDYDALAEGYDPQLADGTKNTYKDPDGAQLRAYFSAWLAMFLKHPVCYFQALHANTFGYYTVCNSGFPYEYYVFINDASMEWKGLDIHYLDASGLARYTLYNALLAFDRTPLLGLLTSRGFMSWLLLALGAYLAKRRVRAAAPPLVCLGLLWLTCIASPVNDLLRYFLPILACVPLVFCLACAAARQNGQTKC